MDESSPIEEPPIDTQEPSPPIDTQESSPPVQESGSRQEPVEPVETIDGESLGCPVSQYLGLSIDPRSVVVNHLRRNLYALYSVMPMHCIPYPSPRDAMTRAVRLFVIDLCETRRWDIHPAVTGYVWHSGLSLTWFLLMKKCLFKTSLYSCNYEL